MHRFLLIFSIAVWIRHNKRPENCQFCRWLPVLEGLFEAYFVRNALILNRSFLQRLVIACSVTLTTFMSGCSQPQPTAQSPEPSTSPGSASPTVLLPTQPLTASLTAANSATTNPAISSSLNHFLESVAASGAARQHQGVWIQTERELLGNYQGTVPLSAASLTKAATSLAALQTLGPSYRYKTAVGITGKVQNGVLQGDLIIQGGQNPFFVWEDAIALAQQLKQHGIQKVQGNLMILGPFYMNFETGAIAAGTSLKQGLDASLWPAEALQQYQTLPVNTLKPQIDIQGTVIAATVAPQHVQWVAQHQSFPLADLLKKMNRYSNNAMAEIIANSIGGASVVQQKVLAATGIPAAEVQLVNGSGLAIQNRMSPRAVCALFLAIDNLLKPQGLSIADIFTVVGTDEGVLDQRPLPKQAILKSGTLDTVSALAGTINTQKGRVWFAILDNNGNVETFRNLQEQLLAALQQSLGAVSALPNAQPLPTALSYQQLWSSL